MAKDKETTFKEKYLSAKPELRQQMLADLTALAEESYQRDEAAAALIAIRFRNCLYDAFFLSADGQRMLIKDLKALKGLNKFMRAEKPVVKAFIEYINQTREEELFDEEEDDPQEG